MIKKRGVFIIAEAGVNHNGDVNLAKKLIDLAVEANVDAVKFQTFKTELCISKHAEKADYQKHSKDYSKSQFDMIKKLELSKEQHLELINYCQKKDIMFFSTGFDSESLEFLHNIGLNLAKIPSGEITNLPYLEKIAELFDTVIISTGMANMIEVKYAVNLLLGRGIKKENLIVLHCNTEYPTPMEDVNLKAMLYMQDKLDVKIGYSDHTMGLEVPFAAVALGATVIEKHFTLDRNLPGPDHRASLEPDELKAMVKGIRNIEKAIAGSGKKEPSKSEIKNKPIARKSIVAKCAIKKGEVFTVDNLAVKRPATGISPMHWHDILGKIANKDYAEDEILTKYSIL